MKNELAKTIDAAAADRLLTACHGDQSLRDRMRPYLHFLRLGRWGYPLVYPVGTFMVIRRGGPSCNRHALHAEIPDGGRSSKKRWSRSSMSARKRASRAKTGSSGGLANCLI